MHINIDKDMLCLYSPYPYPWKYTHILCFMTD